MKNTYRGILDIKGINRPFMPRFVQYDNARLEIHVRDNGKPVYLENVLRIDVTHERSDGSTVIGTGGIVDDEVTTFIYYDYAGSEMDRIGKTKTTVTIVYDEYYKVTLPTFDVWFNVDKRSVIVAPTNDTFGIVDQLKTELEEIKRLKGIKGDPGDINIGLFNIDPETGILEVEYTNDASEVQFNLNDGILEVEII